MKRKLLILPLLVMSVIFSQITVNASEVEHSWYVKRNGRNRPLIQREQEIIYKYDGYFIDKKRRDNEEDKVIYLTYDAGYENGNISKILDVMKEEEVTGAFFILDNIILKNKDLVTRMSEEGHLVCNHTKKHQNLCKLNESEIKEAVLALENLYKETVGLDMSKYFRFPEGRYSEEALAVIKDLGYKTVFWSFAYDDWNENRQPNEKAAIEKILKNTHNGAVILLHPTSTTNANILKTLIGAWKEMGYRFGTLDELVE